jgi:hypothetical protein
MPGAKMAGKRRHKDNEDESEKSLAEVVYEFLQHLAKDSPPHREPDGASTQLIVHGDLVYDICITLGDSLIPERRIKKALRMLARQDLLRKSRLDPPDYYWVVTPPQEK